LCIFAYMKSHVLHLTYSEMHSALSLVAKASSLLLFYFAPVAPLIHAVMALWLIDWITGVWKSRLVKRRITSYRLRKTANKITGYIIAIITSHILNFSILGGSLHLPQIITAYIGITEFTSIMENLSEITGKNFLKEIVDKVWEMIKDKVWYSNKSN